MTQHWHATVEYNSAISTDQAETLVLRGGDDIFVVVGADRERDRTRVSFGVVASTLRQATDQALRTARTLVDGIVSGPAVQVRVMTDADLAAEIEQPLVPELVDTAAAREILGINTQQRMAEVEQFPNFPMPVYEASGGRRIYTKASVEAFNRQWTRKPGRPRKANTE